MAAITTPLCAILISPAIYGGIVMLGGALARLVFRGLVWLFGV